MSLTKEDIFRLALMSRISLSEEEAQRLSIDCEQVISYFSSLKDVPSYSGDNLDGENINVFRDDEVAQIKDEERKILLESFPERDGDYLCVPPVFASGGKKER